MAHGIPKHKRNQILERDGQRCTICEHVMHLEVHHIISISEAIERGLTRRLMNRPENLVTMCQRCHSLTYGNKKLQYWLTSEEAGELRSISIEREQLSKEMKELKKRYRGMWNTSSYLTQKRESDTKFKKLKQSEEQIRGIARQRLLNKQAKVNDTLKAISVDSKKLRTTYSLLD